MFQRIVILLFCFGAAIGAAGQDLSAIRKAKPVHISGYLSASGFGYEGPRGTPPRGWAASGSINFSFFGAIDVPVSLQMSDRQLDYDLPAFKRFGLSPSWRWIKLHGGYRNLVFSPYTLAGFTFLGGGVELTPKKFRFAFMRGNLDRTWDLPSENLLPLGEPLRLFDREAIGAKIGAGTAANFFDLFFFKAKDRTGTGDTDSLARLSIHPQENLSLGAAFKFTFFKRFTIDANGAASGVTENQEAIALPIGDELGALLDRMSRFLKVNSSSRYAFAGDASASLRLGPATVGAKIQHIDPFYRSFGAYYLQTDFENSLFTASLNLFKGKASVSGNYGLQRDNLRGYADRTSRRRIGSFSAQFSPKKGFSASAQFANFTNDQRPSIVASGDSARVATATRTVSATIGQSWKKNDGGRSALGASFSASRFVDASPLGAGAAFGSQNASLTHRRQWRDGALALRTGLTWAAFDQNRLAVVRYGVLLGGERGFGKKIKTNFSENISLNRTDGASDGFLSRASFGASMSLPKKQSLSINGAWNWRRSERLRPLNELTARASWSISF